MRWRHLFPAFRFDRTGWPAGSFTRKRSRRTSRWRREQPVAAAEVLEDRTLLSVVSWDGGGDGILWHDALNWDTDALPGADDDVVIDVPGDETIQLNSATGDVGVKSLSVAETLHVDFITLSIAENSTIEHLIFERGTIDGAGDLTVTASAELSSSAKLLGSGRFIVSAGATASTSKLVQLIRAVDNHGVFDHRGSSLHVGSEFVNHADGTLNLFGEADLSKGTSNSAVVDNRGTLTKSGPGVSNFTFGLELQNTGTVNLNAGELRFSDTGFTTTSLDVPLDTTIQFAHGFGFGPGTSLTGEGAVRFFGGSSQLYDFSASQFLMTGTAEFQGGVTTIANTLPAELTVPIIGGTMIFNADQTLDVARYERATIRGSGDLTLTGNSLLNGLRLEGTGSATIAAGADMSVGGFNATFGRETENFGQLRTNGNQISLGATFTNRAGGEVALSGTGVIAGSGGTLVNEGMLSKTAVGVSRIVAELQNNGTLQLQQGELQVEGAGSTTTTIDVASDAALRFQGGFDFAPGTGLTGGGTVQFFGGTAQLYDFSSSQFLMTGTAEFQGGVTTIANTLPADLTVPIIGGTMIFNANQTLDVARYERPTIRGSGDLTLTGNSLLNGLRLEGTGSATIAAGASMSVGGSDATFRRETVNLGQIRMNGNQVSVDENFVNGPGGEIAFNAGGVLASAIAGGVTLVNDGTIAKSTAALSRVTSRIEVVNNGTIAVQDGELRFDRQLAAAGGVFDVSNAGRLSLNGSLTLQSGGALTGDGTVEGDIINGGTVKPGATIGMLTVEGSYTQSPTGRLEIEIEPLANNNGFQHDVLAVSGAAALDGELAVHFRDDASPDPDVRFDVFTYLTATGDFATTTATGLDASRNVEHELLADRLQLSVTATNTGLLESIRQAFNQGIIAEQNDARLYADGLGIDLGGLPFIPGDAGPLGSLLAIGDTLDALSAAHLKTLDDPVDSFDELRDALETAGYTVVCLSGDANCAPGELLRVRLNAEAADLNATLSTADFEGTPLEALSEQGLFSGGVEVGGRLIVDRGFGVDEDGFFVATDSRITAEISAGVEIGGDVSLFGIGLAADIEFSPFIAIAQLDLDADGKLRRSELADLISGLDLGFDGPLTADLTFDAKLGFLDYIDVDSALPNRPHGGDPFLVRGRATLTVQASQFDFDTFAGLETRWSNVGVLNPDVNSDGALDYTPAVFLKNVLHLGEDLLSGAGVLDYFADVLGIDDAAAANGVTGREANELPGGKLPAVLQPLADERAAVDAIDEALRSLIVLSVGPPSLDEIIIEQKRELRDWFLAEADDDVSREEEQSVQFRIAKIARVLGPTIVANELVELISPIEDDAEFDRLLIEALTDWIRWHDKVLSYGFDPLELLAPTPEELNSPDDLAVRRLLAAEGALIEGLSEAVDRAIVRAKARTDAAGNTDVDALLDDAISALAWSAEAARLSSLAGSIDHRPFDERADITVSDVVDRLPFRTVIESAEMSGPVDDAVLQVQAGLRVENPAGGFFPTFPHERVVVRVEPGADADGIVRADGSIPFEDTTSPAIANPRGSVDASGRFSTRLQIGPADRDLSVVVTTSFGGLFDGDQQRLQKNGDVAIDLRGFLPVVDSSEASLRDGPITVPLGHDVQLVTNLRRGNRVLSGRQVNFFLVGEGELQTIVTQTDIDGEASTIYSPPPSTGDPGQIGTVTVGVAYFENGTLHRDDVEITFAPAEVLLEIDLNSLQAEAVASIPTTGFADRPPSPQELAYLDLLQASLAAEEESVTFADLSDEQRDGLKAFLKTWFEQAVVPSLDTAAGSDEALDRALREFHGWRTQVRLVGLVESDVIPDGNPGGDLNNANAGLVAALREAILRDKSRLFDVNGNLLSTARSLAPLYDALQWSVGAEAIGLDVAALELTIEDVVRDFGVSVEFSNVELNGTVNAATFSVDVAARINGQTPPFDVPVRVAAVPQGFSSVGQSSATFATQGRFETTAAIGNGDDELKVVLQAGIPGVDLIREERSLRGPARIEIEAFAGLNAEEATPGPVSIAAGDVVGLQIDAFRGRATLRNVDLELRLTGAGRLEATSFNTGPGGGGIIEFHPPVSASGGVSIVTAIFDDGNAGLVSQSIAIGYGASSLQNGEITPDGALARDRVAVILANPPLDGDGEVDGFQLQAELAVVFREWFRGAADHPEIVPVQSRLDVVQPGSAVSPANYDGFRKALFEAVQDFQDWEAQAEELFGDAADVFAGHELPGLTAEQEIQSARAKFAPAMAEAIRRQDVILQDSGFNVRTMRQAGREVMDILSNAALLGLDEGDLGVGEALRNSLAFPTSDQALFEALIRTEFLNTPDAVIIESDGTRRYSAAFLDAARSHLEEWFLGDADEGSVVRFLEELQPGSPAAPEDYNVFANRLKKSVRNWLAWLSLSQAFDFSPSDVLQSQSGEFDRSLEVMTTALNEAVRRVAERSTADVLALPAFPSQSELRTVFERAQEAVDWLDVARLLALDAPGSGLSESEIVAALPFSAVILPGTAILTADESPNSRPALNVRTAVQLDGESALLFSDAVNVRVVPAGANGAATTFGPADESTGLFSTSISLGPKEKQFRFTVQAEAFGLTFDRLEIARDAPVTIDLIGGPAQASEAALGNNSLQVIDGQRVRLRVRLTRGNEPLANAIVFFSQVGEGDLSLQNARTAATGTADVVFTPPADRIGRTSVVASYFQDGVLRQDIFDVRFTSTAADAEVVPPISAEQAAAEAQIGAILNQAGLDALRGIERNVQPELIEPMRTWHQAGVMPRLQAASGDFSLTEAATVEYFNWAALAGLLGIDDDDGTPHHVAAELAESTALLDDVIRDGIDVNVQQALTQRDGDAAIAALRVAQFGFESLLVEPDDSQHSVGAVIERLGFEIVIDDTQIRSIDAVPIGVEPDDSNLELFVAAHVELHGVPTEFVPELPIRLNPLGFSSVGRTNGSLSDGEFRTPVRFGNGDRRLRVQLVLGEVPFAVNTFETLSGPVEFVVIARRSEQAPVESSGPLELGAGQTATLDGVLMQGRGRLAGHTVEYQIEGDGTLSATRVESDQAGLSNIVFTPPTTGAGTTVVRAFVLANQPDPNDATNAPRPQLLSREFVIAWDNAAAPVQNPPGTPPPEAAGLFNGSHVGGPLNALSVPGTEAGLGGSLGLENPSFSLLSEHLCGLIAQGASLAQFVDENVELVEVVDFQELLNFVTTGLPDNPAELIRLRLNLDDKQLTASTQALEVDFDEVLPDGMTASATVDSPRLNGQIVFGLDTSSSPFYVLTQRDELSEATTPLDVDFGLAGRFESTTPLIGTPEEPIFNIDSASFRVDTGVELDFSKVAADPLLGGKLRFDNLDELANLRVGFDGDPLDSFQAIVEATLRIPGLRENSTSNTDAVIGLVGAVSKAGPGEPFAFEIRSGGFPELPADLREQLATATPAEDDVYEDNDTPQIVAARPFQMPGGQPSPNLGVPAELLTLDGLSLFDREDWFRFETTSTGGSLDFVRIDFDARRGDLDLALYRQDGDDLTLLRSDGTSTGDFAQVSLLGETAGVYFVKIFDDAGGLNPSYALRIAPPGAAQPGLDLSLGVADLRDLTFVGRIDTNGEFLVEAGGELLIPAFATQDGTPIPIEFFASIDNDRFAGSGTIDLTGETSVLGDDPVLLEVSDLLGTIDVTIPFDGSPIAAGLMIEAASAVVTPDLAFSARVSGDASNPNHEIPGLSGSIDFQSGAVNLDLHRFEANLGGLVEIDARPTQTGNPQDPFQPAVRLTFDPNAAPTDDLLTFGAVEAVFTGLPDVNGAHPTITLEGFGIQHDGLPFLTAASASIPVEVLTELGVPAIIEISQLGFAADPGERLTGDDLVNLNFDLTVSASLELPLAGGSFSAAVEGMTIDMGVFDGGDLLRGVTFESISIDFGTPAEPIDFGAMTVFGSLFLENFDPTPDIDDDPNSIILRVAAGVNLAGIGVSGQLLLTEYGPIAAGVSASFGQTGIPLGPVALYEANVLVLFNEEVPDLPLNDPLRLIEPGNGDGNEFDLSRFRRGNQAELEAEMESNARQFLIDNRNRSVPTWETPFLFALGGTIGPSGQPKDAAAFLADVTIGANIDPNPNNPKVLLFGLGEAFLPDPSPEGDGRLAMGTIGAVLELSDLFNPTFQIAFATPSPGSELSDRIPAEIRVGATFVKDGSELRLDVVGDATVLDILEGELQGSFILDETGLFGQVQITVGAGTGDTSLDLGEFGADVALTGRFELMFNFTNQPQTIERVDRNDAGKVTQIDLPAATSRLFVSGMLDAGGFEVSGAFLMQTDPDGLLVGAAGEILLGDFGSIQAEGALRFGAEHTGNGVVTPRAAGSLTVMTELAVPGLVKVDGSAAFQFSTFADRAIPLEVPKSNGSGTATVVIETGPFYFVRIAGANDPAAPAFVSFFPADGVLFLGADRVLGLDLEGRFELTRRRDELDLHLDAAADVILFDQRVLGATITADFVIEDGTASGGFAGTLTFGDDIELAHIEGELDRFGCLHTNVPFFEHIGSHGACSQKIFVPDQRFNESSGEQEIVVELTYPAIDNLTVTVVTTSSVPNAVGAVEGVHYTIADEIVIPRGSKTGRIPVTFLDDAVIESNRAFHVTVVGRYPNGTFLDRPDTEGDVTIFDDDAPPIGPPVTIFVTPAGNLSSEGPVQSGQPIVAEIGEDAGPAVLEFFAPDLQRADSVRVEVAVRRAGSASGPLDSDVALANANLVVAREIVTLEGARPFAVNIPLVDDAIVELHEEFRVQLRILQEARFAPSTTLQIEEASITIRNDDPERPTDAVVFYNFDGPPVFNSPTQSFDYPFTASPAFTHQSLIAANFRHATDAALAESGVAKLEPTAPPADQTPAAGSNEFTEGLNAPNLLINGGGESGLAGWIEEAGDWSNRLLTDPAPFSGSNLFNAGRLTSSSIAGTNVLLQRVSLRDFAARITGGEQDFQLSGRVMSATSEAAGHLELAFLDSGGKVVGTATTSLVAKSRGWIEVESSATIPASAVDAHIRLVADSNASSGIIPVYFDEIAFSLPDVPYFEFEVTLDDVDGPLETPADFERALGLQLTGIDFWDQTGLNGPTAWELRSSHDGFQAAIASGETTQRTGFGHHVRAPIADLGLLRPIDEPLRLRLYGLGAAGGTWRVDNVALLGRVAKLTTFALPPVALDQTTQMLSRDLGTVLSLNDLDTFDPNGQGLKIVGVGQPEHGNVVLLGGQTPGEGFQIAYQRTNLSATEDTFTYTVTENSNAPDGFATARVTTQIVDLRATADAYTAIDGQTLSVDQNDGLLRNDSFGELDVAAIIVVQPPAGQLSLNPDGSFNYTPPPGATEDSFSYFFVTETEGNLSSLLVPVSLTIVSDPSRQAANDSYALLEDHQLVARDGVVIELDGNGREVTRLAGLLANDLPGSGAPLEAILVAGPTPGELSLKDDGTFSYKPPANFNGQASFTYRVGNRPDDPVATATIHVIPVNDRPRGFSRTVEIDPKTTGPVSITVSGSDLETPSKSLVALGPFATPNLGSVIQTGNLTFEYTPPKGGLTDRTSFTFIIRDDGAGGPGFGYSDPATVTIVPGKSESESTTSKGTASNSYIDAGTVLLDLNGNRIADAVTRNNVEIVEPTATTAADGGFVLFVPTAADLNGNGRLDADEGRLVLSGGTVSATRLPTALRLIAPADATVVTPLTTLLTTLIDEFDMPLSTAETTLLASLGLPTFDVRHTSTVDEVLNRDSADIAGYRVGIQVLDTAVLISHFFSSQTSQSIDATADAAFAAIAGELRTRRDPVRLSDPNTVRSIVRRTALRLNTSIDEIAGEALVTVISQSNGRLDAVPAIAGTDFIAGVARVEQIAQGATIDDLHSAADGTITWLEWRNRFTGDNLSERIEQAVIGNTAIPRIAVADVIVPHVGFGKSTTVEFTVRLDGPGAVPLSVHYSTEDGTLSAAAGEYTPASGRLVFAAGVTEQVVAVAVNGNRRPEGGTLLLTLFDASESVVAEAIATARILPAGDDADPVPAVIELLAPNDGDGNADGLLDMRQSNVVSLPAAELFEFVTLAAQRSAVFRTARTDSTAIDATSNIAADFPMGEIAVEFAGVEGATSVTAFFENGLPINTWYQFGPTADHPQPHWFEFLFDGRTGAQLFDLNGDGLVEQVRLHFIDGLRGDADGSANGRISSRSTPGNAPQATRPGGRTIVIAGGEKKDHITLRWNPDAVAFQVIVKGTAPESFAAADVFTVVIDAGNGNDHIVVDSEFPIPVHIDAGGGNDYVQGGAGDDRILAGPGNDHVAGGAGDDSIDGGSGNDRLSGDAGSDLLSGGGGNDNIFGGAGDDILLGAAGNDQLFGGAGRDILIGGIGADQIDGEGGDDLLIAGRTVFDDNAAALQALLSDWTSERGYAERARTISGEARHPGRNGSVLLKHGVTVFDDDATDKLTGGESRDWFCFDPDIDDPLDWVLDEFFASELGDVLNRV